MLICWPEHYVIYHIIALCNTVCSLVYVATIPELNLRTEPIQQQGNPIGIYHAISKLAIEICNIKMENLAICNLTNIFVHYHYLLIVFCP